MHHCLITGGAGTIGSAFIAAYPDEYEYFVLSRNETAQVALKRRFPFVNCLIGDVADASQLHVHYGHVRPDVVIHAAAMKHIDLAEQQPQQACRSNLLGSLNIISASMRYRVPFTLGVSTDKACDPDSVYGSTKRLMEQCFQEADNFQQKFAIARMVNVAHSNGSVIPLWLAAKERGDALKVTDPAMRRLMMTKREAAGCIQAALIRMAWHPGGFVLVPLSKQVRIGDLAGVISGKIKVVGRRPGEKLDEVLINAKEARYTVDLPGCADKYAMIHPALGDHEREEYSSATAPCMTFDEIRTLVYGPTHDPTCHRDVPAGSVREPAV